MSVHGILSILPQVENTETRPFDTIYKMIGQNTGNLLFTNAVWQQISGDKKRINFSFDPDILNETLSDLIIPAANWLSPNVDFSHLADLVEQLTIPVTLIGLGAQDATYSGAINIPEGTVRFVRAVSARAQSISVRGAYTAKILADMGVTNTVVTGCPSLYVDFRSFTPPSRVRVRPERGLLHSTRYSAKYRSFSDTASVHRSLFRMAYENDMDLLIQSEPEELKMLLRSSDTSEIDDALKQNMLDIYGASSWSSLKKYIIQRCKTYLDIDTWARSLDRYDYAFGTRLHGTIMALNSGVPAVLVCHDSRTREMAEFARIPSVTPQQVSEDPNRIAPLINRTDFSAYYDQRELNAEVYTNFLKQNRLMLIQAPMYARKLAQGVSQNLFWSLICLLCRRFTWTINER